MVKSIFLQDGEEIFVDDEDYERVNQHIWFKDYSDNTRMIGTVLANRKRISLTNFIKEKSFQKEKIIISQKITCQIKEIILDGQDQVIKVFLNIRVLLGEKIEKNGLLL